MTFKTDFQNLTFDVLMHPQHKSHKLTFKFGLGLELGVRVSIHNLVKPYIYLYNHGSGVYGKENSQYKAL